MNKARLKRMENGQLVYYCDKADAQYWDELWERSICKEYYEKYLNGNLDEYEQIFIKYLRKSDRIIEAGCGTARYVVALGAKGYSFIEGVEWGEKTVNSVIKLFPTLPVRVGDVANLKVPDNFYDVYISLGVVEHRIEGPEPYLDESFRILKSGGIAIISVPYVNMLRRIKGLLGRYENNNLLDHDFYQYAFSHSKFVKYLQKSGYKVVETKSIAGYFGLQEEIPLLFVSLDKIRGGWRIKERIKRSKWVDVFGHMKIYICKKPIIS